jgi:hypothetical protein
MDPDAPWQGSPEAAPGKAVEVGGRLMPAPIAGHVALRSTSSAEKPCRLSAAAAESPAIPPPTNQDSLDVGHLSSPRRFEAATGPQRPNHCFFTLRREWLRSAIPNIKRLHPPLPKREPTRHRRRLRVCGRGYRYVDRLGARWGSRATTSPGPKSRHSIVALSTVTLL